MKQAMGEVNAVVVVVLAIGVLMAFFYYTFWPLIKQNFNAHAKCSSAICEKCGTGHCDYVKCHAKNDPNNEFTCIWKG